MNVVNDTVVFIDGSVMNLEDFRSALHQKIYLLDKEPQNVAVVALYVSIFLVAVVTNILVIVVIYRFKHLRRSLILPCSNNDLNVPVVVK